MPLITKPRSAIRALAVARTISFTGSSAAYAALNFVILEKTHSPTWVAAGLFLTFGVAGILSPLTGGLGDRFNRQTLMIASDLCAAVFFVALIFAQSPPLMLLLAFCSAVAESPMFSASSAAIPALVQEPKDISWANAMVQLGFNFGVMIGPALGGILLAALGIGWVFGLNAASFVLSALLVSLVRGRFREDRTAEEEAEHRGFWAGMRFIRKNRILRVMYFAWFVVILAMGETMVADAPFAQLFYPHDTRAAEVGYGLMISAWGLGTVLGSLIGRKLRERDEGRALIYGTFAFGMTTLLVSVSPVFWLLPAFIFAGGIGDALSMIAERGIIQRRTPDVVRSRVFSAGDALISFSFAAAFIVAGPVITQVGPRWGYAIGGIGCVFGACVLLRIRRDLRDGDDVLDRYSTEGDESSADPAAPETVDKRAG